MGLSSQHLLDDFIFNHPVFGKIQAFLFDKFYVFVAQGPRAKIFLFYFWFWFIRKETFFTNDYFIYLVEKENWYYVSSISCTYLRHTKQVLGDKYLLSSIEWKSRVEIFWNLIIEQDGINEQGGFFFENLISEQGKKC